MGDLDRLYPFDPIASLPLRLFDCHAHLLADDDWSELHSVAGARHVTGAICVAESCDESRTVLERCAATPPSSPSALSDSVRFVHPAVGVHPVWVSLQLHQPEQREEEKRHIERIIEESHQHIVCIGEIGLDFSPWILQQAADLCRSAAAHSSAPEAAASSASSSSSVDWKSRFNAVEDAEQRSYQIDFFRHQVRLAIRFDRPINVHSRNASKYVLQVLEEEGIGSDRPHSHIGVLLHAFDGSLKTMMEALRRGYFLSATTALVRDQQMKKVFRDAFKEAKRIEYQTRNTLQQKPATDSSSSPSAGGVAVVVDDSVSTYLIPSILLQLVLETDSPALHPIKQPPPSQQHTSSETSACCQPENNHPANLYIALLEVYQLYVDAERMRSSEQRSKQMKQRAKDSNVNSVTRVDRSNPIVESNAASSTPSAPPTNLTIDDTPIMSLTQFASLLYDNTLRLFPRITTAK